MDPTRQDRLLDLLGEAMDLQVEARAEFLDRACAGDASLRAEVDRLLLGADAAAAAMPSHHIDSAVGKHFAPPEAIGPYRIVRQLGRGGMGAVYLATQLTPVKRAVAVKLLLPGMDSQQILSRFEMERQSLASMSHPNVAQVLDAGATDAGRPYFVMEYVDGLPITEYCDQRRLSTQQRIELFIDVCDALQHAHQKAVIHRDVKPSNVLVMEREGRAIPKVIDFGIARVLKQGDDAVGAAARTLFTEHGQLVGTLEYMSPEQAQGSADIDTRTDVYSLGVLLYELLTGGTPFDKRVLRESAVEEIRRVIREVDPPKPSTRLSQLGETSPRVAQARGVDPRTHVREVRGELDWITMRAIEKDRTRRYGSPAELAADLARHLRHEPVLAGPPSSSYRVRKLIRRHRTAFVATTLVALSLIAGTATTTFQAVRARRAEADAIQQRDLARKRFDDVRKLAGSFIFDVDDAIQTQGATRGRQKLIETARQYLDALSQETNEPELLRELVNAYNRLGSVQSLSGKSNLGDPAGAIASFRKAIESADKLVAALPDDLAARSLLADCWYNLGVTHADHADVPAAQECWTKARSIYQWLADADAGDWMSRRNVSMVDHRRAKQLVFDGEHEKALAALKASLESRKQLAAQFPGKPMLAAGVRFAQSDLATFLNTQSRPRDALVHLDAALSDARVALAASPEDAALRAEVSQFAHRVAEAYRFLGQFDRALELADELVAVRRERVEADANDHDARTSLSGALFTQGMALMQLGRLKDALAAHTESLELRREALRRTPGSESAGRWVCDSLRRRAEVLRRLGRAEEALPVITECIQLTAARTKARPGDESAAVAHYAALGELSRTFIALSKFEQAVESLAVLFPTEPPPTTAPAIELRSAADWLHYGVALLASGQTDRAVAQLRTAVEQCRTSERANPDTWEGARDLCLVQAHLAVALARSAKSPSDAVAAESVALLDAAIASSQAYAARFPVGPTRLLIALQVRESEWEIARLAGQPARADSARMAATAAARELADTSDESAGREALSRLSSAR